MITLCSPNRESDNPLLTLMETSKWKYTESIIQRVKMGVLVNSYTNVTRLHKLYNGPKPNVSSLGST